MAQAELLLFFVGSCTCSEDFSPCSPVLPSTKTGISKFQFRLGKHCSVGVPFILFCSILLRNIKLKGGGGGEEGVSCVFHVDPTREIYSYFLFV